MAKNYFRVYHRIFDSMAPLNDAERGRLFAACLAYSMSGEEPELRGSERYIFPAMREQIDRDNKRSSINRDNVQRRYTNAYEGIQTPTNDYESLQTATNAYEEKEKEGAPLAPPLIPPSPSPQTPYSYPPYNPPINPPEEREKEYGSLREPCVEPAKNAASTPSIPYAEVQRMYNELCNGLPKCSVLSEARKKAIRARFSSGYTLEDFRTLFQKAGASPFLHGKNNRNWRAGFDWLIRDSNMAKTVDGNYDDRTSDADAPPNTPTNPGSSTASRLMTMLERGDFDD